MNNKNIYRGIIHIHSCYSYDSILSIENIAKFALKNKLNFVCVTDHNTIAGSLALKQYVEKHKLPIEVIIGAEYKTSLGDIIALGIKEEIKILDFDSFIEEVKKQGGLLLFPHPYKGHKNIDYIAKKVDLIEVFNSRVGQKENERAKKLALKYGKQIYFASDAHTYLSLGNCIIEFEKIENNFLESLLKAKIRPVCCINSYYFEVVYSQFLKSLKLKDVKIFLKQMKNLLKLGTTLKLFKKIS